MADRYWVGGTDNWDGTAGTKWSTTDGGAGGAAVPTSADDVYFTASSTGTCTISAGNTGCKSLICTGFTGTLAGSAALTVSGGLTLASGMTYSYTGTMTFDATSTGWTITSAGLTLDHDVTFNGAGGGWGLADNTEWGDNNIFTLTQGRFDTNDYTMGGGRFSSSNTNTRVLSIGSSVVTWKFNSGAPVPIWTTATATNLTILYSSGIIEFTGAYSRTVSPGAAVLPHIRLTSGSNAINLGNANVASLSQASSYTGALANTALSIREGISLHSSSGTPSAGSLAWAFTATSGSHTLSSGGKTLDFPINLSLGGSSTATWTLGGHLTMGASRDFTVYSGTFALSSYDLTVGVFSSSTTTYARAVDFGSGGIYLTRTSSSSVLNFAATNLTITPGTGKIVLSGASSITRIVNGDGVALPSLEITAGSGATTFTSVNVNDFGITSGYTGTLTNQAITIRGSVSLPSSGPTFSSGSNTWTLAATSGTKTVSLGGQTTSWPWVFGSGTSAATWQLTGDMNVGSNTITVSYGTLSAISYNVTAGKILSTGSGARGISLGSGTWTLGGTTPWEDSGSNLTVTAGTSGLVSSSTSTVDFKSSGKTFYGVEFNGSQVTIRGSNTFHELTYVKADGVLYFEGNSTTTVTTWSVEGTSGHLLTVSSLTSLYHYLVSASPQVGNYLQIMWSSASPDANWSTTNSTDLGNNVGWFTNDFPFYSGTRTAVAVGGVDAAVLAANPGDVLVLAAGYHTLTQDVPSGVTLRGASCAGTTTLEVSLITPLGGNTFRDLVIRTPDTAFNLTDIAWFENCTFYGQVYSGGPEVNKYIVFSRCTFHAEATGNLCESNGAGFGSISWNSCLFRDNGYAAIAIYGNDWDSPPPGSQVFTIEHCTFILEHISSQATALDLGSNVVYINSVAYQPTSSNSLGGDASGGDSGRGNFYQDNYTNPSAYAYLTQVRDLGIDVDTGALRNSSPARVAADTSDLVLDRNYLPYGAVGSRSAGCFQWHPESSCLYTPWFLDPVDGFVLEYEPGTNLPTKTTEGLTSGATQVNSHIEVACLIRKGVHDLTHPSRGDFHTTWQGGYRMRTYDYPMNLSLQAPASRIFGSTGVSWGQDTG